MQFSKISNISYSSELSKDEHEFILQQLKNVDGDVEYEGCVTREIFMLLVSRFVGREFMKSGYQTDMETNGFVVVNVTIGDKVEKISLGLVHVGKEETSQWSAS